MSPLALGLLTWVDLIHRETGEDPKRIVVPRRTYEMLLTELSKEPRVYGGDPVSGVGPDDRLWLACTEIVPE